MILAIDIGNTNIVIGCIKDDKILFTERMSTDSNETVLEYAIVDESTFIGKNVKIGEEKSAGKGIAVIGRELSVGDNVTVEGGAMIEKSLTKEDK